jgi:hypothetical protein
MKRAKQSFAGKCVPKLELGNEGCVPKLELGNEGEGLELGNEGEGVGTECMRPLCFQKARG